MARKPRVEKAGGIHHVRMRGNRKAEIFLSDRDREFFIEQLHVTAARYGWIILAYCLMSNHFHLVVETAEKSLGAGMGRFAGYYAQTFNRRHGFEGHVFGGRFKSTLVETDEYFATLMRYVAFNPVAARLCNDPSEWRWSSHNALLNGDPGMAEGRARVEELLGAWGGRVGSRYARLLESPDAPAAVDNGDTEPRPNSVVASGTNGSAAGQPTTYGAERTPSTPDTIADNQPP